MCDSPVVLHLSLGISCNCEFLFVTNRVEITEDL